MAQFKVKGTLNFMRHLFVAFLACVPVVLASAAQTTGTDVQPVVPRGIESTASDRATAHFAREDWGLSEAEWTRYQALMQGIRGSVSPDTLSPIEVLGIHARSPTERRKYALLWARMMKADAERILAFQRAYDDAWRELNPSGQIIDPAQVPRLRDAAAEPLVRSGDRLLLFVRLDCPECEAAIKATAAAAAKYKVQLDVYIHGAPSDDAIRTWAKKKSFDRQALKARRITLNHERGELARTLGTLATVPAVVRLRGQTAAGIEPYRLLQEPE